MTISFSDIHVLHVLPDLGVEGYGVAAVVNGLLSGHKDLGQPADVSTILSPWFPAHGKELFINT